MSTTNCVCGCGELIPAITKNGNPARFKHGHNANGINNYFHKNIFDANKHWNWKGGKYLDNGYTVIYKPDHPFKNKDGCVREHRLVMEKHIGRYLTRDEHVHHINGIKTDNRVENLMVLTNSEHRKLHKGDYSNRHCIRCNSDKTYVRKTRNNRPEWFRFETGFECRNCHRKRLYNNPT